MLKIQAGEYECVKCKKLTIIGRTKKSDEPLTCCDVEMVPKEKVKFTEAPEPNEEAASKSGASKTTGAKKKKAKAKKVKAKSKVTKKAKTVIVEVTLPLAPGSYMCPTCGYIKDLGVSDARDKWLRCKDCFVKMLPNS